MLHFTAVLYSQSEPGCVGLMCQHHVLSYTLYSGFVSECMLWYSCETNVCGLPEVKSLQLPVQVLRALKPPLSGDMYSTLLHCLQQCLYLSPQLVMAREVALELVLTFTALVEVLPPGKLILYPQVGVPALPMGSGRYRAWQIVWVVLRCNACSDYERTSHSYVARHSLIYPCALHSQAAG